MKFKLEGKEFPAPSSLTIGESMEAERLLGIDFQKNAGGVANLAVLLYAALRRADPSKPPEDVAELVKSAEIDALGVEEEADPVPLAESDTQAAPAPAQVAEGNSRSDGGTEKMPTPLSTLATAPPASKPSSASPANSERKSA